MIISCEQCQARFKLADEKLKADGTKVRCSKCQSIFTVFPPIPEPVDPEVPTGPVTGDTEPAPEQEFSPPAGTADGATDSDFVTPAPLPGGTNADEAFPFATPTAPADREAFAASADRYSPDVAQAPATGPAEFDFDDAFAEESAPPELPAFAADPGEFDFGTMPASAEPGAETSFTAADEFDFAETTPETTPPNEFDSAVEAPGDTTPEEFDFGEGEPGDTIAGESDFAAAPSTEEDSTGFDFTEETATSPGDEFLPGGTPDPGAPPAAAAGFGEVSFAEESEEGFSFGTDAEPDATAFGASDGSWGDAEPPALDSFSFDEPEFESHSTGAAPTPQVAEPGFGEIDFSDGDETGEMFPSFDGNPDFSQPAPRPEPSPPPLSAVPPPVQKAPASRPRSEEPLPLPARRCSPVSTMVVTLGVLLVVLCGAGGYLYMSGDGERLIGQLVMKIKGEKPAGPVEQLIGLNISNSSYVNNREAGQLLVVQGTAVNNFAATRSAISVKGLLLNAAGKTIQQQTVFCGNPLSEEKLRTLKYAEIEEAMSNQFGNSLTNMNVKPGTAINFTIVFRNVPKEMANINVEIVDSKPGGS